MKRMLVMCVLAFMGMLAAPEQARADTPEAPELDVPAPAEETVTLPAREVRSVKISVVTAASVVAVITVVSVGLLALLGASALTGMLLPLPTSAPYNLYLLRESIAPVALLGWAAIITVCGAVAGSAMGVAAADFLALIDGNSRVLGRVLIPAGAGLAGGTLAALLGMSTGLLLFVVLPQMLLYRPFIGAAGGGAGCARCSSVDSTRAAPPSTSGMNLLPLIPAAFVSSLLGVAALGLTHAGLGAVSFAARE